MKTMTAQETAAAVQWLTTNRTAEGRTWNGHEARRQLQRRYAASSMEARIILSNAA
jgi:hypothetical protein